MPLRYQTMPAQAIKCQLHDNEFSRTELQLKLKHLQHSTARLRILAVFDGLIHVQLEEDVETKVSNGATEMQSENTNPFMVSEKKSTKSKLSSADTLEMLSPTKIGLNQLSELEREILMEEPMCTSNVMKAIHGYNPKVCFCVMLFQLTLCYLELVSHRWLTPYFFIYVENF